MKKSFKQVELSKTEILNMIGMIMQRVDYTKHILFNLVLSHQYISNDITISENKLKELDDLLTNLESKLICLVKLLDMKFGVNNV